MGFIFTHDHIQKIINETKDQTRRVVKPGERFLFDDDEHAHVVLTPSGRVKWRVGDTYAVQPGRGLPGVWWSEYRGIYRLPHDLPTQIDPEDAHNTQVTTETELYETFGWHPLRIRLLSIRREPLQDISEADAVAEGVVPLLSYDIDHLDGWYSHVSGYRELWGRINGPKSWDATGDVWRLAFEVVRA